MKDLEFMHARASFGAAFGPSRSSFRGLFSSRNISVRHFIRSSESSFGLSTIPSFSRGFGWILLPTCFLGFSLISSAVNPETWLKKCIVQKLVAEEFHTSFPGKHNFYGGVEIV